MSALAKRQLLPTGNQSNGKKGSKRPMDGERRREGASADVGGRLFHRLSFVLSAAAAAKAAAATASFGRIFVFDPTAFCIGDIRQTFSLSLSLSVLCFSV